MRFDFLYVGLDIPIVAYLKSFYTFTIPERVNLIPAAQNIVSDCKVEPGLPQGLSLNKKTCEISGIATAAEPSSDYIITPRNGAGDGDPVRLNIAVIDCSNDGEVAYSITYLTGDDHTQIEWTFMTSSLKTIVGNDITVQNKDNSEYYFSGCAPSTNYILEMSNPRSGNGPWPDESYVEITITGMPALKFRKTIEGVDSQDIASNLLNL